MLIKFASIIDNLFSNWLTKNFFELYVFLELLEALYDS